jgi:hypothetical protein
MFLGIPDLDPAPNPDPDPYQTFMDPQITNEKNGGLKVEAFDIDLPLSYSC